MMHIFARLYIERNSVLPADKAQLPTSVGLRRCPDYSPGDDIEKHVLRN